MELNFVFRGAVYHLSPRALSASYNLQNYQALARLNHLVCCPLEAIMPSES